MITSLKYLSFIVFFFCGFSIEAQIEGLWVVKQVNVGEKQMTPVAKWFNLKDDGTQFSGNGWLQHSYGTWQYGDKDSTLILHTVNEMDDGFGAFHVVYSDSTMLWERVEDGQTVIVKSVRADVLPPGPVDKIKGVWILETVFNNGVDVTNDVNVSRLTYLFLRWDRIFIEGEGEKVLRRGAWVVDGHRPVVTLISDVEAEPREKWSVEFFENGLILTGLSDHNKMLKRVYRLTNKRPQ
ncbi:MAG TPA: hypothetical protein VD884_14205 [Ohtaekwangia sp.]|nr:hypothetical protein [Ohtaekwangia sp.]